MNRTEFTYGQLDEVLRSLGFTARLDSAKPPAMVYEHRETGAFVQLPPFPPTDRVLEYHLVGVRGTLDNFGIADPSVFAARLQEAG